MSAVVPTPYEDLLRDVLEHGTHKDDRTGTGTTGWVNSSTPLAASAANFQSAAHAVNTQGKALGVMAWNYSIGKHNDTERRCSGWLG